MKKLFSLLILVALLATLTILVACKQEQPEFKGPENEVPHVHKYDKKVVEPTCDSEGYTEHTCKDCGYYYRDNIVEVNPNKHTKLKESVYNPKDCTEKKITIKECLDCGFTQTIEGKAGNHVYDESRPIEVLDPTCTEKGHYKYECLLCGYIRTDSRPAPGHCWGEWIVDVAPVCSINSVSAGEQHRECSACDAEEHDIVLPHKSTTSGTVVLPTCTTVGYTEYVCDDCGTTYRRDFKEPLGHDYCPAHEVEGKPGLWCTHCEICGYSKIEEK
ncbi:MAG: hypothetical protein J6S23_02150 [Clostridia bacterium]|nr:hypothetical protein [Clostridia bacterium]